MAVEIGVAYATGPAARVPRRSPLGKLLIFSAGVFVACNALALGAALFQDTRPALPVDAAAIEERCALAGRARPLECAIFRWSGRAVVKGRPLDGRATVFEALDSILGARK